MSPLNAAICTTISYTLWVECWKYYLIFFYLTLRSKVKVTQRSCTYKLFQWTALLDLFELFDLEVKGQGPTKVITVRDTLPYGHAPTYQLSLTYLERQKCYGLDKKILFKKQLFDLEVKGHYSHAHMNYLPMISFAGFIWPWGKRSRSHEGHYSTRHTALWSCTHIPIIIDLSRKTKMLWSGQASLRRSRSGRKNQTKTICLPSFEWET